MKRLFSLLTYLLISCYVLRSLIEVFNGNDNILNLLKTLIFSFVLVVLGFPNSFKKGFAFVIFFIAGILTLPIMDWKENYFGVLFVDILEHALLLIIPFVIYLWKTDRFSAVKSLSFLRVSFGITFIGHALYASGIFVAPVQFTLILSSLFSGPQVTNEILLYVIFVSDISVGLGLIIRFQKWSVLFYYCLIWTILATTARFYTFYPSDHTLQSWLAFFCLMSWRVLYIVFPWVLIKKNSTV